MRKLKKNIFIGTFAFLVTWQIYENSTIELCIPTVEGKDMFISMPRKDRKSLQHLFYKIMIREDGAYTLFGSKPMHMNGFYKPFSISDWEIFLSSVRPNNIRMYWGWKTWQKYQYLFAKSGFLFWAEPNPFFAKFNSDNPAISIFFLNKQKFEEAVNSYMADFQTVLKNQNISADQLLLDMENKSFFNDVLRGHNGLIGTLFGYGRDNAWLFEEREIGKTVPLEFVWGHEIDDSLMYRLPYSWVCFGIQPTDLPTVLDYPCFAANPDSAETKQLKQKFLQTRKEILDYYQNKDFLTATFSILINGSP